MAISEKVNYAELRHLYLDPYNQRLGRKNAIKDRSQDQILEEVRCWVLVELAQSYLANRGFWTHEALLVTKEVLYGDVEVFVVIDGNRRLAALKLLNDAVQGNPISKRWEILVQECQIPKNLFSKIPYIFVDNRDEIQAFLGFQHIKSIKKWGVHKKAGLIARLIENEQLSYKDIVPKIGSSTSVVRQLYIAYRLLLQIEDVVDDFDPEWAENCFHLLYTLLQTYGTQQYLGIDIQASPEKACHPVANNKMTELNNFTRWLFGSSTREPLITNSLQVSRFGRALENDKTRAYLEKSRNPNLELAYQQANGSVVKIINCLEEAAENLESTLSYIHLYQESPELQSVIQRVISNSFRLSTAFPNMYTKPNSMEE